MTRIFGKYACWCHHRSVLFLLRIDTHPNSSHCLLIARSVLFLLRIDTDWSMWPIEIYITCSVLFLLRIDTIPWRKSGQWAVRFCIVLIKDWHLQEDLVHLPYCLFCIVLIKDWHKMNRNNTSLYFGSVLFLLRIDTIKVCTTVWALDSFVLYCSY